MRKFLLFATSASILLTATASSAQDNVAQDDRFKPRIYGGAVATSEAESVKAGAPASDAQIERVIEEAYRVRKYQGVGGGATPAQSAPQATPAQKVSASANEALSHKVKQGDTLYNLSKRYNVKVEALQEANNISDNKIEIGQSLTIPKNSGTLTQASTASETIVAENRVETKDPKVKRVVLPVHAETDTIYAVLPKDTLYSISKRSCVKVGALVDANGLSNPNVLKPGQKLKVPEGHCLDR
ncbi:LysM peptidoglycan-binding domain-containing protein [Litorimonas sp.]|uniref:lytic transglycosylase n=1 Tax=Litorimonas sp. TaxID=1892381 RepID=UPI003A89A4AB